MPLIFSASAPLAMEEASRERRKVSFTRGSQIARTHDQDGQHHEREQAELQIHQ